MAMVPASSKMLEGPPTAAPVYISKTTVAKLQSWKVPEVMQLDSNIQASSCTDISGTDMNPTKPRIDLCDYGAQTNLLRERGSEMWRRNLDFMELFAGSSIMTRTFRENNYKACPGRLATTRGIRSPKIS